MFKVKKIFNNKTNDPARRDAFVASRQAAIGGVLWKKVSLEISQNSQPETCNFIKKETLAQVFSCEFCKISKNTFFTEHLQATASEAEDGVKNLWGLMDSCYSKKTTTAQKDHSYLIDWLVSFVTHAHRLQRQYNFAPHNIVAMDETAV